MWGGFPPKIWAPEMAVDFCLFKRDFIVEAKLDRCSFDASDDTQTQKEKEPKE